MLPTDNSEEPNLLSGFEITSITEGALEELRKITNLLALSG